MAAEHHFVPTTATLDRGADLEVTLGARTKIRLWLGQQADLI